jgi:flagellar motor switch protein FliM
VFTRHAPFPRKGPAALRGGIAGEGIAIEMSAEQMTSLMQRKARTGREAYAERAMTLGRALRLTAAKQAEHLMGMAMNALGVTRRTIGGSHIKEALDASALMLLMDGPNNQVGAAILDPALVAGLIQQQTTGKVAPLATDAAHRSCAATDATLCAPFIVALMTNAAKLAEEAADQILLEGYRFGVWAREARQNQMALDQHQYEMIEVTLDLAGGASVGKLHLILPHPPATPVEETQDDSAGAMTKSSATLSDTVFGLQAEMMIALTRVRMPLQKVSDFKVGGLLDISVNSLAQALVIDATGSVVSRGTLGQIDGMRAVQVEQGRTKEHTQPRRRASDCEALDLPDVTLPFEDGLAPDFQEESEYQEDDVAVGLPAPFRHRRFRRHRSCK